LRGPGNTGLHYDATIGSDRRAAICRWASVTRTFVSDISTDRYQWRPSNVFALRACRILPDDRRTAEGSEMTKYECQHNIMLSRGSIIAEASALGVRLRCAVCNLIANIDVEGAIYPPPFKAEAEVVAPMPAPSPKWSKCPNCEAFTYADDPPCCFGNIPRGDINEAPSIPACTCPAGMYGNGVHRGGCPQTGAK
jgi:hypothetical protein